MGSTDKAVITGFICRLCSKMNRFVIHIYGEEGERMKLAEKINAYLPITVNNINFNKETLLSHSRFIFFPQSNNKKFLPFEKYFEARNTIVKSRTYFFH